MSARDEAFGVGVFRDDVSIDAIEQVQFDVLSKARVLAHELHRRSSDEKLTDAETDLLNIISVYESYKLQPWSGSAGLPHT